MISIRIEKRFAGKRQLFEPGVYAVPGEMSEIEARMSIADGVGKWEAAAKKAKPKASSSPGRKKPAPENKLAAGASDNKVAGLDEAGDSGAGAEPDGANGGSGTTQRSAGGRGQ